MGVGGGVVVGELEGIGLMHHVRVPAEGNQQLCGEKTLLNEVLLEGVVRWIVLALVGLVLVDGIRRSSHVVVYVKSLAGHEVHSDL